MSEKKKKNNQNLQEAAMHNEDARDRAFDEREDVPPVDMLDDADFGQEAFPVLETDSDMVDEDAEVALSVDTNGETGEISVRICLAYLRLKTAVYPTCWKWAAARASFLKRI